MKEEVEVAVEALVELLAEKGLLSRAEIVERMWKLLGGRKADREPHELEFTSSLLDRGLKEEVKTFERKLVEAALKKANSIKAEAARLLGVDTNQMNYLCRKHHL